LHGRKAGGVARRNAGCNPDAGRTSGAARLRVQAVRHGQRLLRGLLANEAKAGRHFTKVTWTRASPDFAEFLLDLAEAYPEADTIHLVLDNLSTHSRKAVVDWYGEEDGAWLWDRFTIHHTPKHGSWLNQAEIEIGLFSRQCLGKRRIPDIDQLTQQANAWNQRINQNKTTIQWTFTKEKARKTLK